MTDEQENRQSSASASPADDAVQATQPPSQAAHAESEVHHGQGAGQERHNTQGRKPGAPENDPGKHVPGSNNKSSGKQESAKPVPRGAVARSGRSAFWLLWLVVILLCGALGAFYWQQTRLSLNQASAVQTLQERNQQLGSALEQAQATMQTQLQEQLGVLEASGDSLTRALSDMRLMEQADLQRMQDMQLRVDRQNEETRNIMLALQRQVAGLQQRDARWLNAEAAYLMRLATQKLSLENNPQASLQLLQSVEGLLRDQLEPLARTAHQNLLQDIAALQSAQVPDRFELAQRVSELASALDDVSVSGALQASYMQGLAVVREQTQSVSSEQGWTAALVNLFRSIFVWRQTDSNPLEFLPADQQSLIKLQLRLQLEQARLAVVQADQRLFEDALQQVAAGLQRYFMQDSEAATRLHDNVQALAVERVQGEWPDLSTTRALVEQLQGAEPMPAPVMVTPAPTPTPTTVPGPGSSAQNTADVSSAPVEEPVQ